MSIVHVLSSYGVGGQERVALVPAVEPDRFSEKTTADAQPKQGGRHGATGCFPNAK